MKIVQFVDVLVPLVLSGERTITWRVNDTRDIKDGDVLSFCWKTGKEFAQAKVLWAKETVFANIDELDPAGHQRYKTDEEMYATFTKYYGYPVTKESRVKVIKFILL